jgi:hypothetical protein
MRRTGAIAFCGVCSAPIAQAQSLTADESEEIPPQRSAPDPCVGSSGSLPFCNTPQSRD